MKIYILIITILFMSYSCDDSSRKNEKSNSIDEITSYKSSSEQGMDYAVIRDSVFKIDIEFIKNCAKKGIGSFNMDSINNPNKYFDNSVIDNVLGKVSVNNQEDLYLKANQWERFSCYQWEENNDYFLFTILQQDESCCLTMYLCVSNKTGKLLTIRQLGLNGGDGGWSENDWGVEIEFGKFHLYNDCYFDEDKFEDEVYLGYMRENQYTEIMIELEKESFVVDTLVYTKKKTLIKPK